MSTALVFSPQGLVLNWLYTASALRQYKCVFFHSDHCYLPVKEGASTNMALLYDLPYRCSLGDEECLLVSQI